MANGTPSRADQLVILAREKFPQLTAAEEKFLRHTADAQYAVFGDEGSQTIDPSQAGEWKEDRVLKADCIAWMCADPQAKQFLTHRGVLVVGARIDGELDLQFVQLAVPLAFFYCAFPKGLNLRLSNLHSLVMQGSHAVYLAAAFIRVERTIYLRNGFKVTGKVALGGASIDGDLDCGSGLFLNPGGISLDADGARILGDVILRDGFKSEGEVNLIGASIGGTLDCEKGLFFNKGKPALTADGIKVSGSVFLRNGFKSQGEVNFNGASVGGNFECSDARFSNRGGRALIASSIKAGSNVLFSRRFAALGEVRLVNASISGSLDCDHGLFSHIHGYALVADNMKVERDIYLRGGCKLKGRASFVNTDVGRHFQWRDVCTPEKTILDLRSAKIKTLWDDKKSWPRKDQILLQGFVYEELFHSSPSDSVDRIDWLDRQQTEAEDLPADATRAEKRAFFAQPYEQLAAVLRKAGLEDDANQILIEKNKRMAKWTSFGRSRWLWYRVLGPPISFGYRPGTTFFVSLVLILLGAAIFGIGFQTKLFSPAHEDAYKKENGLSTEEVRDNYPRFNSIVYSAETFVPLVKFYQAEYWLPDANRGRVLLRVGFIKLTSGGCVRAYLWFHTVLGWTLTSFWVAGLTGVIKKKA
ncbi:MAG: hypothetical protein ABR611_06790 [Chthoniobacterales bacterium]